MKPSFTIVTAIICAYATHINTAYCTTYNNCVLESVINPPHNNGMSGCPTGKTEWRKWTANGTQVFLTQVCITKCESGYSESSIENRLRQVCINYQASWNYHTCSLNSSSCTNCTTSEWRDSPIPNTYKQYRTYCNASSCTQTLEFRCNSGYYGTPANMTDKCTQCPQYRGDSNNNMVPIKDTSGNEVYGSSYTGAKGITQCYIPAGNYTDSTGSFKISGLCFYN